MEERICRIVESSYTGPHGLEVTETEYEQLEEVVRCRDCEYASPSCTDTSSLDCMLFSHWDYYDDCPGEWQVPPDGFCKWGRREGARLIGIDFGKQE